MLNETSRRSMVSIDGSRDHVVVAASVARRCPVCDADRPEVLFDNRMAPIASIDFGYAVVACGGCGMTYASRAPDDATLEVLVDWTSGRLASYKKPTGLVIVDELPRNAAGKVVKGELRARYA